MKRGLKTMGPVLAGICFTAGLAWLAVPRLSAELTALAPLARIADESRVREFDTTEVRNLAVEFERAAAKHDSPRYSRAALAMYYQLHRTAKGEAREAYRRTIIPPLKRELVSRPMQSRIWGSVSSFSYDRNGGDNKLSRDALLKSIELRENALSLVPARLRLILLHWRQIPVSVRAELKPQFVQTWRRDPYGLIALAKNKPFAPIIRGGLSNEPAMLGGLEVGLGNR